MFSSLRLTGLALALLLAGCASPPQTTRMTADDLDTMALAMARSLRASDAIARRGPDSPMWIVSIDRVQNLSSDVMAPREQWAVMANLRGSLPMLELWDSKQIRFVLPPERVRELQRSDETFEYQDGFGSERPAPTHTLAATFRSAVRATADTRVDVYYAEFELMDLATGIPVWIDKFEFKRNAHGSIRN